MAALSAAASSAHQLWHWPAAPGHRRAMRESSPVLTRVNSPLRLRARLGEAHLTQHTRDTAVRRPVSAARPKSALTRPTDSSREHTASAACAVLAWSAKQHNPQTYRKPSAKSNDRDSSGDTLRFLEFQNEIDATCKMTRRNPPTQASKAIYYTITPHSDGE